MKLQDFHVETADWAREEQRAALLDLRDAVLVREPGEQRDDGRDADCRHVLARDDAGQPIGCARLGPDRVIGYMAVLPAWRGRGVGTALLRELVGCARAQGWKEVAVHAQGGAAGFYERAGFAAYGDASGMTGEAHRALRLALPVGTVDTPPPRDTGVLPARGREEIAAARLQLLADTRHRLCLRLPLLDSQTCADAAELAELRRIATSGRRARVRILLHDPAAALRDDHRLVALAQRLSSAIEIRMPVEETDLAFPSCCLLNDVGGYLFLPEASRASGRAARDDRAAQVPLQQHFDEAWERSVRATMLQPLDL